MTSPTLLRGVAAFGLALLSTGCDMPALAAASGSFERSLQVSGREELTVTNGSGEVRVTPGADGMVRVVGRITAHDSLVSGPSASEKIERLRANPPIVQTGAEIKIGEISDRGLNNVSIDYDITVPACTRVHSRSGSGDQRIGAVQGGIEITAGSGDIEVQGAGGDMVVTTGSGDITLSAVSGTLRARTGSGDINIQGRPAGDWTLGTGSGDVALQFPADTGFTVDASAGSGSVHISHPLQSSHSRSGRHVTGTVRGGGASVEISTGSGSISID